MPFAVSKRAKKHFVFRELDIVAILNIFLLLIPFLLYSVVFSRMVALNLRLPERDKTEQSKPSSLKKPALKPLRLFIGTDSLRFFADTTRLSGLPFSILEDSRTIKNILTEIAQENPDYKTLVMIPNDSIQYQSIIAIMDISRQAGFKKISMSY